jgi:hypothetical protein
VRAVLSFLAIGVLCGCTSAGPWVAIDMPESAQMYRRTAVGRVLFIPVPAEYDQFGISVWGLPPVEVGR